MNARQETAGQDPARGDVIGRVVATEALPSSAHQFHFWTAIDTAIGIGAIVRIDGSAGRVVHALVVDGRSYSDLAAPLHLPVVHALWRIRSTVSQTGLTAAERQRNVRRAFCLSPLLSREKRQRFIDGQAIVLLDDVMTTGATSNECAGVLVRAGASEVRIVTLARAPLHSEGGARSFSAARETEARHP